MHQIYAKYNNASLTCYGITEVDYRTIVCDTDLPVWLHLCPPVDNMTMQHKLGAFAYWLYPCTFEETFCLTALEVQAAGCICLCNRLAALATTVCPLYTDLLPVQNTVEITDDIVAKCCIRLVDKYEHMPATTRKEFVANVQAWASTNTWNSVAAKWIHTVLDRRPPPECQAASARQAHGISLSIPLNKFRTHRAAITLRGFSPIIPGQPYSFTSEADYYNEYSTCMFALTTKKAGWDCMRHLEIIAAGSVPYFIDIENCPDDSMTLYPKTLLLAVKTLPGIPSQQDILTASENGKIASLSMGSDFDISKYLQLRQDLYQYVKAHCSCEAMARFVAKKTIKRSFAHKKQHVLFVCEPSKYCRMDYQRDSLFIGFVLQPLQFVVHSTYELPWCFADYTNLASEYGRGFTIGGAVKQSVNGFEICSNQQIYNNVAEGIYDLIVVCSASNYGPPAFAQSLIALLPTTLRHTCSIAYIDGNDIHGDHTVPEYCNHLFKREGVAH